MQTVMNFRGFLVVELVFNITVKNAWLLQKQSRYMSAQITAKTKVQEKTAARKETLYCKVLLT